MLVVYTELSYSSDLVIIMLLVRTIILSVIIFFSWHMHGRHEIATRVMHAHGPAELIIIYYSNNFLNVVIGLAVLIKSGRLFQREGMKEKSR